MTTTIRLNDTLHKLLKELAEKRGQTMQIVLEEILEKQRKEILLLQHNQVYASLSEKEWQKEKEEREAWDNTLSDDLGDENE